MPGIVGLITRMPQEQSANQLFRMLQTLCHEKFYTSGTYLDRSLGVYAGWTAQKNSSYEGMPLRGANGDPVLLFSGENFPDPEVLRNLKRRVPELDPDGTSYLVSLYEEDPAFPAGLNGRFHGLVIDRMRGTAMLFNDRYGMHRLYCHEAKDAFYFASEAKAILAVLPELRRINSRAMGEFVACGAVLENRTLFDGVSVLPPASAWIFRGGPTAQKKNYFRPSEWEEQEELDPESWYAALRKILTQNLPRYFTGRQRIAMSLTGGLDTRMLLACCKPEPGSLPCFTFGSMFRENYDVRMARRVAQACGQSHSVITAGEEFLSRFSHYAERTVYLTEGCADVGRAPDLYLNEKARKIAPVRMTGNYGGEVLRGVRAFKAVEPAEGIFSPEFQPAIRQGVSAYRQTMRGHPVSLAVFKQAPWSQYGVLALEQSQLSMRSPYLDNDFVRTVFRAPAAVLAGHEASLRLIADGDPGLLRIPTDRGLSGSGGRVAQAAYRGFLEFLFKAEYAYDMGMPQWLARIDHVFSPLCLEKLFLGRHKPFHFRVWYRDALAGYVQELLLDPRALSRPYLKRQGLEAAVRGHLRGDRNYTRELHTILTLEILHRLFLDKPGRGGMESEPAPAVTANEVTEQSV